MLYKVLCWTPVEEQEPKIYKTKMEAHADCELLSLTQPDNIYKVVEIDSHGRVIHDH